MRSVQTLDSRPPRRARSRRGARGSAAVLLGLCVLGLSSCSVIKAAHKIERLVHSNKDIIDGFTKNLQPNKAVAFEATYTTSGTSPTTVVYAVRPPGQVAFSETPSHSTSANPTPTLDLIVNSSGEYSCSPASSPPSCLKLPDATAASENAIVDFYTPSHWSTFLSDFALTAGIAGDSVSTSDMKLAGVKMKCVDFVATGQPGKSTICTTPEGVLGYVKVAGDSTVFSIKSYSTSPSGSLFSLPAGAKITVVTLPATTTT